jgi:ssDNA-binding replication factor A large subunit
MEQTEEESFAKVKDLTPSMDGVNLFAKVLNTGERRSIDSKFGGWRDL